MAVEKKKKKKSYNFVICIRPSLTSVCEGSLNKILNLTSVCEGSLNKDFKLFFPSPFKTFFQLKAELKSIGSHHRAELNQHDRQLQEARSQASAGEENLKKEVHSLKSIINGLEDRLGEKNVLYSFVMQDIERGTLQKLLLSHFIS